MEQKRQNKQKRRAAFTLAEFLTVIAIVGILASLSFVAVIRYQRKLRRLEMDQTAKEIFLAAQNHLTLEVSNGTIPRLLHMEAQGEFSDDQKQAKLGISVENTVLAEEKEGNIYAVLYVPEKQAGQPESEQEEKINTIFDEQPYLSNVYPNDTRKIGIVFEIKDAEIEYFNLGVNPIFRESYTLGTGTISEKGYIITDRCIECGKCQSGYGDRLQNRWCAPSFPGYL